MSQNCGRCGKPVYIPGLFICDSCRKMLSKDKDKHTKRLEDNKEQEVALYQNIADPRSDDDSNDVRDLKHRHYLDTHDASAVWVDRDVKKGKKRR
ncbi:hypothetical protein ACFLRF_06000 [Candidatus Altiarchaeota archaeon]